MDGQKPSPPDADLAAKIARLVEERGWNQEDFARIADLNRHTVRQILKTNGKNDHRKLRNATISQCAAALGLQVNELRNVPLDKLLQKMHGKTTEDAGGQKRIETQSASAELLDWLKNHPERAAQITREEADELLAQDGPGKGIAQLGAEHFVELIERRRRMLRRVGAIANTGYFDLLEQLVNLMFEKIQVPGKS